MCRRRDVVILLAVAALMACSSEESTVREDATTSSSATASSGPGGGSSVGSGPPPGGEWLGLACEEDAACGPGGRCLRPTDDSPLGGGPAGGYCSRGCDADAECPGLYSVCKKDDLTGAGMCFLGCEWGPDADYLDEPLERFKCRGREDVRCAPPYTTPPSTFPPSAFCQPTCGMDAQCPAGRTCDPRSRLCVTTPSSGLPMGAKCDAERMCAGHCSDSFGDEAAVCTSLCVYGGKVEGTADCGGLETGLCAVRYQSYGAGDEGQCVPACDEHDDCAHPFFWCQTVRGQGYRGYCLRGADSCPAGTCQAGTCTETIYGPRCLEPKYPLGSAAPQAGGAAGGGGARGN
ncbi:MAG: hypothetical protein WKG00_05295 [Polyangiaceae bacterium]